MHFSHLRIGRMSVKLTKLLRSALLSIKIAGLLLTGSTALAGQSLQVSELQTGNVLGTVTDVNGGTVSGATVVLESLGSVDRRTSATGENGYFEFNDVKPGVPQLIKITANGFAGWQSDVFIIKPGEFKIISEIRLRLATVNTTVDVQYDAEEVATEQVKIAEQQRVLGFIPNFYVVYTPNPEPLTPKLKFRLALRLARDPITAAGIGLLSAGEQAADTPDYGQGAEAFGKRFGANAADGFSSLMIGSAILPSLLHQDPRYFYQGTGSTKSRLLHALSHPFVCKSDTGSQQINFSSMGGDLASAAISNAYYPKSNRGAGLVFTNFAINTAERLSLSLAQEFILRRFTHKGNSSGSQ